MPVESKDFSSSMIGAASYDPDTGELTVQMRKNGRSYTTTNFTPQEWESFKSAWSPGKWWHDNIRGRE